VCGPSHLLKSGPVASGSVRIQIGMNVGGADGTETGRGAHGAVTHGGDELSITLVVRAAVGLIPNDSPSVEEMRAATSRPST
jgi:hypothetical protein